MTRPVYEPNLERTDAALGYDKAQLQRRPAQIGSGAIEWIRLNTNTLQTIPSLDRVGVIYEDVTNNYLDIFDFDTTGGDPWAVLLLTSGLYQATSRVQVGSPEPPAGFSLELLGTDYMEGLSGFHSVYYPGYVTFGSFPPPSDGLPFTSTTWEKIDHMFMGYPTFFAGGQWEIEAYISTASDAVDIISASLEVRRIGDLDFFPYGAGS